MVLAESNMGKVYLLRQDFIHSKFSDFCGIYDDVLSNAQ